MKVAPGTAAAVSGWANDVAIDRSGAMYVTGTTLPFEDFPTTDDAGPPRRNPLFTSAYIAKFEP